MFLGCRGRVWQAGPNQHGLNGLLLEIYAPKNIATNPLAFGFFATRRGERERGGGGERERGREGVRE